MQKVMLAHFFQCALMHTNRLAKERSPYLKQHQFNPVDWYPWGPEAFLAARNRNVPIFLSIGYSTCHWCHVMERESFSNERIAGIMNENFVNIKVDREERPDVDSQYMTYVQMRTGHGGWPLSVFLTAELRPFFGGTYFPPSDTSGLPGFDRILRLIAEKWETQQGDIVKSSILVTNAINSALNRTSTNEDSATPSLKMAAIADAYRFFNDNFDEKYGGFGLAPKFRR
jgi:uncharacterized protein YyaL (SSP411 family)